MTRGARLACYGHMRILLMVALLLSACGHPCVDKGACSSEGDTCNPTIEIECVCGADETWACVGGPVDMTVPDLTVSHDMAPSCGMTTAGVLDCNANPCCDRCQIAQPGAACSAGEMCAYSLAGVHPECVAGCGNDGTWHFTCPQNFDM
jgi:hypothetical protein